MKKATRREIKQAAIRVTLPTFKKFEDELRDVAEQYGLRGEELDLFLATALGDMAVRCEFAQETLAAAAAPSFGMFTAIGNAEVFKAIKHMEGTGRVVAAMQVLMDLANRKGTREAYDTAVRDEVYRFVVEGR